MYSIHIEGSLPEIPTDLTEAMKELGKAELMSVQANFMAGGRPSKWKDLVSGVPSFLVDSGLLYSSIHSQSGSDWFEVLTGPKSSVPYIFIHQFGGVSGRGHKSFIPARPYMLFQETDEEEISGLLTDYIIHFTETHWRPIGTS